MFPAALVLLVFSSLQQTPSPNPPPLRLTLKRAITIAMEGNAGVRIATEVAQQADSRVAQARAGLLPNIDGQVSQSNQTRNLEALGLRAISRDSGFTIPRFVGPFKVFDARATGPLIL